MIDRQQVGSDFYIDVASYLEDLTVYYFYLNKEDVYLIFPEIKSKETISVDIPFRSKNEGIYYISLFVNGIQLKRNTTNKFLPRLDKLCSESDYAKFIVTDTMLVELKINNYDEYINIDDYHYTDESGNDCVLKDECGNKIPFIDENGNQLFKLDENGNYTAKYNLFSDSEVNSINKVLGTVTQKRFIKQKEIYSSLGLNAMFKLYPGNHRTIFDNREVIFADVDRFINNNLKKEKHKSK